MGIDSESAIGTTLQMGAHAALLFGACHNVDGTGKCLTAIHPAGSTLNHFNAFDVIHIHREVGSQMSRVGVADVDAVEQDGQLVFCTAIHTYVCLDAKATTLAHIDSCR